MRFVARYIDLGSTCVSERELEAASREDACRAIKTQGHALIELRAPDPRRLSWRRSGFDLRSFCLEFRAMLIAGLGVVGSIEALVAAEQNPTVRAALESVLQRIREGKSLAAALDAAPNEFPPLFRAAVRGGEASGELPESVGRFASYLEATRRVRQSAISAAIYPLIVCGFGLLVVGFLVVYVVPRFAVAYSAAASNTGWATQTLLWVATTVNAHWQLVFALLFASVYLVARLLSNSERRARIVSVIAETRGLRPLTQAYFNGQLYRTLAMMLTSGYTVPQAIASGHEVVRGTPNATRLSAAAVQIDQGKPVTGALAASGLTDEIAYRLIGAGERSGRLAEMMAFAADHYERRLATMLERASRLIEPALMMMVALLIGTIVVVMYMPIFDLATGLQ